MTMNNNFLNNLLNIISVSGYEEQVQDIVEEEMKEQFDEAVYEEQVGMMEMVLDCDEISEEMAEIRDEFCKYL